MKEFDWESFGKDKIVVHCKTEKEATDFCKQSHEHGFDWCTGASRFNITYWDEHESETCYDKNEYYNVDWYKKHEYTILEWNDYMYTNKKFTKADLKDGMIVQYRYGSYRVVIGDNLYTVENSKITCCYDLDSLNDDLTSIGSPNNDIITVCLMNNNNKIMLFDRNKPEEMTLEEVCKELGREIKIVKK